METNHDVNPTSFTTKIHAIIPIVMLTLESMLVARQGEYVDVCRGAQLRHGTGKKIPRRLDKTFFVRKNPDEGRSRTDSSS